MKIKDVISGLDLDKCYPDHDPEQSDILGNANTGGTVTSSIT